MALSQDGQSRQSHSVTTGQLSQCWWIETKHLLVSSFYREEQEWILEVFEAFYHLQTLVILGGLFMCSDCEVDFIKTYLPNVCQWEKVLWAQWCQAFHSIPDALPGCLIFPWGEFCLFVTQFKYIWGLILVGLKVTLEGQLSWPLLGKRFLSLCINASGYLECLRRPWQLFVTSIDQKNI